MADSKKPSSAPAGPKFNFDPISALAGGKFISSEIAELARGNMTAMATSAKIATTGVQDIGRTIGDMGTAQFNSAAASLSGLASVRTPIELLQLQSELVKSFSETLFSDASTLGNAMLKLMADVSEPLSQRYAAAADKITLATAR